MARITGLETEYGCLVSSPQKVHEVLPEIRDWIFENDRYGLIDLHHRDWDEPAGNGGFLFNGGRVYIDMGHLEVCTPECLNTMDVVRYDLAGDAILNEAVKDLGLEEEVFFIRNNIDHYTGATFGCHENYSMERYAPFTESNVLSLLAFLTVRVLMVGAGCVDSIRSRAVAGGRATYTDHNEQRFLISQRADYIQNDFYEWVQQNRAIINTRDEPLADPNLYRRLHLLHGDTNVLPSTNFLKIGSTRLVLELLENDDLPQVELINATGSLRRLSRQLTAPWPVRTGDGQDTDAIDLLGLYLARAKAAFAKRDQETDAILDLWARTLDGLSKDRTALVGLIDWITKEYLLQQFCESEGLAWGDPWLEAQDIEFHNIHPEKGLGLALANMDGYWNPGPITDALLTPPSDTRANARSALMRQIQERQASYLLDWDAVGIFNERTRHLRNPFDASVPDLRA